VLGGNNMAKKTEQGLLLLLFGTMLLIFSTLVTIATPSSGGAGATGLACLSGAMGFFGYILILVGLILVFTGRKEFGEKHRQFVTYGLVAIVIGIVIIIIGFVVIVIGAIAGIDINQDPSQDPVIDYSEMAQGMTTGIVITQIGGVVILIGEILLVFWLQNDMGKKLLYITLIVGIITTIITTFLISALLNDIMQVMDDTPENEQEDVFTDFTADTDRINAIGLIPSFLLLIAFYLPYDRIKKGELKPIVPPPPFAPPPGYVPGPQYQQYPPYPQYPPPGQYGPPPQQPPPMGPPPSQPPPVTPIATEVQRCAFCGSGIPKGIANCPACGRPV
jgi:hypothetical protein